MSELKKPAVRAVVCLRHAITLPHVRRSNGSPVRLKPGKIGFVAGDEPMIAVTVFGDHNDSNIYHLMMDLPRFHEDWMLEEDAPKSRFDRSDPVD